MAIPPVRAAARLRVTTRSPEPLSDAAQAVLTRNATAAQLQNLRNFINSPRTQRVYYELLRYCRGEQPGVSLLISGSRGAGKTTLARFVIQELIIEAKLGLHNAADRPLLIPLPIYLHGPTLLKRWSDGDDSPPPWMDMLRGTPSSSYESQWRELVPKAALKKAVLLNLIAALYRNLATILVRSWSNANDPNDHRRSVQEVQQLRAHLDLRLDMAPEVKELRRIWKRAGFLPKGVAHHLYPIIGGQEVWAASTRVDQGVREILALSACAVSFLSVLGKTRETLESETKRTTSIRLEASASVPSKGQAPAAQPPAAQPQSPPPASSSPSTVERLVPAAVGGATAITAIGVQSNIEHMLVGLAGAAVLYGLSIVAPRWIRNEETQANLRASRQVDVDWSERRLERELPILIDRIKAAGFAPIFMIDELDKLDDTQNELDDFLNISKHMVRDYAAFLFLTDRSYYETLIEREAGRV